MVRLSKYIKIGKTEEKAVSQFLRPTFWGKLNVWHNIVRGNDASLDNKQLEPPFSCFNVSTDSLLP